MEKILIWPDCDGGRKSRSIDRRDASMAVVSGKSLRKRPWDVPRGAAVCCLSGEHRMMRPSGAGRRKEKESSYSSVVLLWCNGLPESGLKEDGICEGLLPMLLVPRVRPEV